jgi:hypothetical protein
MRKITELARATIADDHELRIIRVRKTDQPELIVLVWPARPTAIESTKLAATTTTIVACLAEARIQLAALRANRS